MKIQPKPLKRKKLFVLNIYTLSKIVKYIQKNNKGEVSRPFINALAACDDKVSNAIIEYRNTIFPIVCVDFGYALGFNTSTLSFDHIQEYNFNNSELEKSITNGIISLSNQMLDYIKLRKHVYVHNIVDFKNEAEQNNNIEQFLKYYNESKSNRANNINSSLKYMDLSSDKILIEMSSNSFVQNLYKAVIKELLKDYKNLQSSVEDIEKLPLYKNYEHFIRDYRIAKEDNFKNLNEHTNNIVLYFKDLIWKLIFGKLAITHNQHEWLIDILNDEKNLKLEIEILRKLIFKYTENKQTTRTSINSNFYKNIDEKATLYQICKQMYILLNYGNEIYGLHK